MRCSCDWVIVGAAKVLNARDTRCELHGDDSRWWRRLRAHAWEHMTHAQRDAALRCAAAVAVDS